MTDFQQEGAQEAIADDIVADDDVEDRSFDNLDDAAAALAADSTEGDEAEAEANDEDEAETEGDEPDEDDESEDEAEDEGDDAVEMVTLKDGTQIPISEIESGAYRQADYTRKTTELAREREEVESLKSQYEERTQSFQQTFQKLTNFVEGLVPPAPPLELARSDPSQYQYQVALRQQALSELQGLMQVQEEAQGQLQGAQQQDYEKYKATEDQKLAEVLPDLKDPAKRAKFDEDLRKTGVEFGFTAEEVDSTPDHRIRQALHYARLGKIAEQNRQNAKRRVEAPKKGPQAAPAPAPRRNKSATKRLRETGSIDDAVRALMG